MAEELRCITIKATMSTGTSENDLASFKNDAARDLSIRKVHLMLSTNGGDNSDSAVAELSMDPTIASNIDQNETPRVMVQDRWPPDAGANDGGHYNSTVQSFAKGQWILRPGNDVHLNDSKSTNVTGQIDCVIWYHYN